MNPFFLVNGFILSSPSSTQTSLETPLHSNLKSLSSSLSSTSNLDLSGIKTSSSSYFTNRKQLSFFPMFAVGFGQKSISENNEGQRHLKLKEPIQSVLDPQQQQRQWEKEYKAYLKRNGPQLCLMSWKGFQTMGRGAIFAKYDGIPSPLNNDLDIDLKETREEKKKNLNDEKDIDLLDKYSSIPSLYIEIEKWESNFMINKEERKTFTDQEQHDCEQVLHRILTYDPHNEFVVVFQAAGLMGADIVKPSIPPSKIDQYVDFDSIKENSPHGDASGIVTKYNSLDEEDQEDTSPIIDIDLN